MRTKGERSMYKCDTIRYIQVGDIECTGIKSTDATATSIKSHYRTAHIMHIHACVQQIIANMTISQPLLCIHTRHYI